MDAGWISKYLIMYFRRVILVVIGFGLHTVSTDCPALCECKWKNGKESVTCLNANLSHVPLQFDQGTQVLDLTGNNIPALKKEEFYSAGLLNLQRIFVSKCRLKSLHRYVFRNLKNLIELDLSVNLLNAIPSHTFDSISELRELKLSENPIKKIMNEAFVSIPRLIRLDVSDCEISIIEIKSFVGLEKSLEWLRLDGNNLVNIEATSLVELKNLHGLELARNPWNCSCALRPLKLWVLKTNIPFGIPPLCHNPKRLKEKSWEKLDLDDFACIPNIFPSDSVTRSLEGENVTITCKIEAVPEPDVKWIFKNRLIPNISSSSHHNNRKFYMVHFESGFSNLTIFSADFQDAGMYICVAENRAGKAESTVSLAISRKPLNQTIKSKVLLMGILIGLIFVTMLCLVGLCLYPFSKSIKFRGRECDREENYEKIELNHKIIDSVNGSAVQRPEINERNGDYCVIPAGDTDQELDEDETSSSSFSKISANEQQWQSTDAPQLSGQLTTSEDILFNTRDNYISMTNSTSGRLKQIQEFSSSAATSDKVKIPMKSQDTLEGLIDPVAKRPQNQHGDHQQKIFPDIMDSYSLNRPKLTTFGLERGSNSEGESISDISELFCTLQNKSRIYKSSDSDAPLLRDNRYLSSGGESYNSRFTSLKRMDDSQKYVVNNLNKNRANKISNSFLSLCRVDQGTFTKPVKVIPSGIEPVLQTQTTNAEIFPTPGTPNANSYDYHATQLERFLEEYMNLQKQLTQMKETCDNLRQEKYYSKSMTRTSSTNDFREQRRTSLTDVTYSPIPNNFADNSVVFNNCPSELTMYLLTESSSPKSYVPSNMANN